MAQKASHTSRSLTDFKPGARVRIETLDDCPKARCRLCAMGLTPGTTVTIRSNGSGPCRLSVRGSEVVIGRGMAHKVTGRQVESVRQADSMPDIPDNCIACSEDL